MSSSQAPVNTMPVRIAPGSDAWSIPTIPSARNAAGTTVLFALQPRGVGTPFVESLSSYVLRVSAAHVKRHTTLIHDLVIRPQVQSGALVRVPWILPNLTQALNGAQLFGALIVGYLEALTGVSTIRRTTTFERLPALRLRTAFRTYRAWCPRCIAADAGAPYDRLLWSFRAYTVCVTHERALVDACTHCGARRRALRADVHGDRCGQCAQPLGNPAHGRRREVDGASQLIFDLLARLETGGTITRAQIASGTSSIVATFGSYNKAQAIALAPLLHRMAVEHTRVDLESLVRVVTRSGDTLASFLRRRPRAMRRHARTRRRRTRPAQTNAQRRLIAQLRAGHAAGAVVASVNQRCHQARVSPCWLRREEPALYAEVLARSRAHRRVASAARLRRDMDEMRADVTAVVRANPAISLGMLRNAIPRAARFRSPTLNAIGIAEWERLTTRHVRRRKTP